MATSAIISMSEHVKAGSIGDTESRTFYFPTNACLFALFRTNRTNSCTIFFIDYWCNASEIKYVGNAKPSGITFTKSTNSNEFTVSNAQGYAFAYIQIF